MADRSTAEVLALLQALEDVLTDVITDQGGLVTLLNALEAQFNVADPHPVNTELSAKLQTLYDAMNGVMDAVTGFADPIAKVLGLYAGSPNLNDRDINLRAFQAKLVADADELEQAGYTKFTAMDAGGGNTGNGTIMVHNIDPAQGGDISHVETLTLRCSKSYPDTALNAEEFVAVGATPARLKYLEAGSGMGGAYQLALGGDVDPNALSGQQPQVQTGDVIASIGGDEGTGNLVNNGDFEDDSLTGEWTVAGSNATLDTASAMDGVNSLKFAGDDTVTQDVGSRLNPRVIYGLEVYAKKSGTPTGTLTIKLKDGSTDHITITKDISTLTTSPVKQTYGTVLLPASADMETLKVEVKVASYGGSGNIYVDNVVLASLVVVDGGRALRPVQGLAPWRKGDVFTKATTNANTGDNQKLMRFLFKRAFEADSAATDWPDN